MGFFDKLKGAVHAVTGGAATVTIEFHPAVAFPGETLSVRVTATAKADIKGDGIFVDIRGRDIRYVVTLRPLWFLDSTPEARLETVLHELWHASTRFDGTLHGGRRHAALPAAAFNRRVRALRDRYLAAAPPELLAPFAFHGVARARMWLERPAAARRDGGPARRLYTERQLFYGLVRMRTPGALRLPAPRAARIKAP